jgi:hypothetical protein
MTLALVGSCACAQLAFGPIPGVGSSTTGWAQDDPQALSTALPAVTADGALTITGDTRVLLVHDHAKHDHWGEHSLVRVTLQEPLAFTIDLSHVPCNCIARVYLVAMGDPSDDDSHYCDLSASTEPGFRGGLCTEVDLVEANSLAFSSNLHTRKGVGHDGSCNEWGCVSLLGLSAKAASLKRGYGPGGGGDGHAIDSTMPFRVQLSLDLFGGLRIVLGQEYENVVAFDGRIAGARPPWPSTLSNHLLFMLPRTSDLPNTRPLLPLAAICATFHQRCTRATCMLMLHARCCDFRHLRVTYVLLRAPSL